MDEVAKVIELVTLNANFLNPKPTLMLGSSGDYVRELQRKLIDKGYQCGGYGADGYFGKCTRDSLIAFQTDNNLTVDGICGEEVWSALDKVTEKRGYPATIYAIKVAAIREGASKKKALILKAPKGSVMAALEEKVNKQGNLWYKVQYNDTIGWSYSGNFKE